MHRLPRQDRSSQVELCSHHCCSVDGLFCCLVQWDALHGFCRRSSGNACSWYVPLYWKIKHPSAVKIDRPFLEDKLGAKTFRCKRGVLSCIKPLLYRWSLRLISTQEWETEPSVSQTFF